MLPSRAPGPLASPFAGATLQLITTLTQVRWSEFLCQFNLTIHFHPSHLGTKPDMLMRQWDIYPKEGGSDYASVNPHNLCTIFMQEQLASSLCATFLSVPALHATIIMDIEKLRSDIRSSLCSNLIASTQLDSHPHVGPSTLKNSSSLTKRSMSPTTDLWLCVLQYKHDHPVSGHFGQYRTLELVWWQYVWLKLRDSVKSNVKSCNTCMRSKSQRHHPYVL